MFPPVTSSFSFRIRLTYSRMFAVQTSGRTWPLNFSGVIWAYPGASHGEHRVGLGYVPTGCRCQPSVERTPCFPVHSPVCVHAGICMFTVGDAARHHGFWLSWRDSWISLESNPRSSLSAGTVSSDALTQGSCQSRTVLYETERELAEECHGIADHLPYRHPCLVGATKSDICLMRLSPRIIF